MPNSKSLILINCQVERLVFSRQLSGRGHVGFATSCDERTHNLIMGFCETGLRPIQDCRSGARFRETTEGDG
ncbi:hypothetical protein [Azospirillum argentinense]